MAGFSHLLIHFVVFFCILCFVVVSAFDDSNHGILRSKRQPLFVRNRLVQGRENPVEPVKQPTPNFGNGTSTVYRRVGESSNSSSSSSSSSSIADSSVSGAKDCNTTYVLENGQNIVVYSRHDLYKYQCNQTYKPANSDTTKVYLTCYDFSLKFNCYFESLSIEVNKTCKTYCRNDKVPDVNGTEIKVAYNRNVAGFNGGYVCIVSAKENLTATKTSDVPTDIQCGVTVEMEKASKTSESRVVGGQNAVQNGNPWMAYLKMTVGKYNYEYRCGGSLITKKHVITAAHCLYGYAVNKIDVYLGKYDVSNNNEPGQVVITTSNYVVHESYDDNLVMNDIAIVYLGQEVTLSDSIRTICLPPSNLTFQQTKVTATGWGALSYGGYEAQILQEVQLDIQNNSDCQKDWRQKFNDNTFDIFDSQICAKSPGKDTCSGDSGGPLIYKNDNKWNLVGLTSFGYKCADPDVGGVYTRVTSFLSWINTKIA